jgi:hypothetical protein
MGKEILFPAPECVVEHARLVPAVHESVPQRVEPKETLELNATYPKFTPDKNTTLPVLAARFTEDKNVLTGASKVIGYWRVAATAPIVTLSISCPAPAPLPLDRHMIEV